MLKEIMSLFRRKDMSFSKKAQVAGVLIGTGVALIVGVIALKVVNDIIANTTFTGITSTVVSYITVGLAIGLLVIAFGMAMR